jgi:hypothetical protein
MDRRVLCSAVVEPLTPPPVDVWRVEVWGQKPYDRTRVYTIRANGEDNAARDGLRQFTEEMLAGEALTPAGSD